MLTLMLCFALYASSALAGGYGKPTPAPSPSPTKTESAEARALLGQSDGPGQRVARRNSEDFARVDDARFDVGRDERTL
jgi:hypothetical protein